MECVDKRDGSEGGMYVGGVGGGSLFCGAAGVVCFYFLRVVFIFYRSKITADMLVIVLFL